MSDKMKTSISVSQETADILASIKRELGTSASEVIERAVAEYFATLPERLLASAKRLKERK